ncbi:YraN family protein [Wansuia hejianensis]|uniref:UPF0102 protein H8689_05040 n=1 Tax=Wansuia hejianensis TaxID=2763667 RepID=A0A926EV89_9FIRM|nr:YraN family protein [Wansuia hejianensis]MBC8590493.1 YraN family protein [Wansuia hejianensis]
MRTNIEKGKYGENVAKKYLLNKGYKILETNYRNKIGEIDIISLDKGVLVFIEVKTRTSTSFGYAFEAVNYKKQRKIYNTSTIYVKQKRLSNIQLRYDIIEVYLTNKVNINHIENAFCL